LKWYDGGEENGITSKRIFEVEVFFSSLADLGVFMIFDEKITSLNPSFQMASIYWRWTYILEWSYACQHG
jgi:hypothetical protein